MTSAMVSSILTRWTEYRLSLLNMNKFHQLSFSFLLDAERTNTLLKLST